MRGRTVGGLGVALAWGGGVAALAAAPAAAVEPVPPGFVLLNELKVNPPGDDGPFEFVELRGTPGWAAEDLFLMVIEGDAGGDPGRLELLVELSGIPLGANGILVIVGEGHPYDLPPAATVVTNEAFGASGGALENGSISVLLASCPWAPSEGRDLDKGDNGTLEQLPFGTVILDAVGWRGNEDGNWVYGGAEVYQPDSMPDAAGRFPGNDSPTNAAAWFSADLADGGGAELRYGVPASENFPWGTVMTPGHPNYLSPAVCGPAALSGVVGDPTNPGLTIGVDLTQSLPGPIRVSAVSDNPAVVPDSNLVTTALGPDAFTLHVEPIGRGYAGLTVYADNGETTGRWSIAYAASIPARPGGQFLTGVSDGSAAAPVDADWMLVADDENQVIRLYPRHRSGAPVAEFDLGPDLNLTDYENGVPREVDFEGVTRVGDILYWLGSHSHAEIGELRPNRWRVVATRLAGIGAQATLSYVGHYEHLRDDLLAWDLNNGHGKGSNHYGLVDSAADGVIPKEPHGAGFNIEGLAMAPDSTNTAYLCFRAPLVPVGLRARSLIVPVTNFPEMARAGGTPGAAAFGEPFELFFGGRSIRGIEGGPEGYLITAGPVDNQFATNPTFYKLYTWSGDPTDPPRERSTDLTFLNPECIVELPPAPWIPTRLVQVITDTGRIDYYGDGIPAKLLPEPAFKKFRSDWIELGEIVETQPVIESLVPAGPDLQLRWFAQTGRTYQVEASPTLAAPAWTNLAGPVTADLPLMTHALSPSPGPAAALRLLLLPPP